MGMRRKSEIEDSYGSMVPPPFPVPTMLCPREQASFTCCFYFLVQMVRGTADIAIHDECDDYSFEHPDRSTLTDLRTSPGGVTEFFHCAANAGRGYH